LAIFKSRLPPYQDIVLVFGACAVPAYSWTVLILFRRLQSFLTVYSLNLWDLIGVLAYALTFAFLESAIYLLSLILLSAILPVRFFRQRFVAHGSVVVLLTAVFAMAFHYRPVTGLSARTFGIGLALYAALNGALYVLIRRYGRLEAFINAFTERLTVLLYVYITLTVLGVTVVVVRNL
jgi:hypothetical protein